MINIDFIKINHSRIIGRLLPFWARGHKMAMLMQSLIYPLKYDHANFHAWALEKYIESHITGQKLPLEWYLKYKLGAHLLNPSDKFFITQSVSELIDYLKSGLWENDTRWNNYIKWNNGFDGNLPQVSEEFNGTTMVYAPAIMETVSYDYADYERDIRYILSKYMINFSKINLIFATK